MVSFRARLAVVTALGFASLSAWLGAPVCLDAGAAPDAERGTPEQTVDRWLARQESVTNWTADFVQTRSLKTLKQPLVAPGSVVFSAPNRFRWSLGNPPQTVAVRQEHAVLVIYPLLKRAERYPMDTEASGPWRPMLALMEAGFPRRREDLDRAFRWVSVRSTNGLTEVTLEPKAAAVRRMMPRFKVTIVEADLGLHSTELGFADGSWMRNEFSKVAVNPGVDPAVFEPVLGPEVTVTEPMKGGRP